MAPAAPPAIAAPPRSGGYGQLKLAFDNGRVTGAFNEARNGNGTEAAPQFGCAFALVGEWRGRGRPVSVLTWWPGDDRADERIRGQLTVRRGEATLKLAEDPGGCSMTGESFKSDGYNERLTAARSWLEVREVKRPRAAFRAAPGGPATRAYVTAGDTVGVMARAAGFVRVQYVDGRRVAEGWLASSDLQPATPAR